MIEQYSLIGLYVGYV
uniref:Uncharacterized protein n=1 Tax=Anguilla anguilla TaxID=7936 RepID=A0A0E9TUK1_ANGAN